MTTLWTPPRPFVLTKPKWVDRFLTLTNGAVGHSKDGAEIKTAEGAAGECECCCAVPKDCLSGNTLPITFMDVDASVCSGCHGPGVLFNGRFTKATLDGSYELPRVTVMGSICVYQLNTTIPGHVRGNIYVAPGCSSIAFSKSTDSALLLVHVDTSAYKIVFISAGVFSFTGSADPCVEVPNQLNCGSAPGDQFSVANGGTAIVG